MSCPLFIGIYVSSTGRRRDFIALRAPLFSFRCDGGYFIFRREGVYLKYVLPALCLLAFVILTTSSAGIPRTDLILPEWMAMWSVWVNTATATISLVFIVLVMNADLTKRNSMDAEMRKAIVNGDFKLHYQPQFNDAGRIAGPRRSSVGPMPEWATYPPASFIPLAEETGLNCPIETGTACCLRAAGPEGGAAGNAASDHVRQCQRVAVPPA